MKTIAIQDMKKRSAVVAYDVPVARKAGAVVKKIRCIKSTPETGYDFLFAKKERGGMTAEQIARQIAKSDSEIDFEKVGMTIKHLHRFYADENGNACKNVRFEETIFEKDGSVKEVRPYSKKENSISDVDNPLKWTGVYIPYETGAQRFVVSKILRLRHIESIAFDFMYDIAKDLEKRKAVMYVGAGEDGKSPVVLQAGGKAYRAFLKGETAARGMRGYKLLLLLSEMQYEDF